MQRVVLLSLALHGLALVLLLALRWPAPAEPDEPARIEVFFGSAAVVPPAAAAAGLPGDAATAANSLRPPAGADAASAVRAADPGLRVERADPLFVPARDDEGNRGPAYPEVARRLRQGGTVLLRLHVGADGAVTRVETLQSSGVAVLDAAAMAALATWHFLPAERAGQPVPSYRDQPVRFVLD